MKNNKVNQIKYKYNEEIKSIKESLQKGAWESAQIKADLWRIEYQLNQVAKVMTGESFLWVIRYNNDSDKEIYRISISDISLYYDSNCAFFILPRFLNLRTMTDEEIEDNDDQIYWLGDFDPIESGSSGAGTLLFTLAGKEISFYSIHKDDKENKKIEGK